MSRAPWPVGLAFAIAVAVLILLVGPLLLFNPAFTSILQERHAVAAAFGTTQSEVGRVTTELLVDLWTDGAFDSAFGGQPALLDASERSHMHDVATLVRTLGLVTGVAAAVAIGAGLALRGERQRRGRLLALAAGGIGAAGLVLALVFAIAFEPAFLAFHALFFPPGTYLFEPGSNLITLFPQPFWFDASIAAGATVIVAAALVGLIGWRQWRSPHPSADGA